MLLVVLQLYIILQWVSLFCAIFGIYSFIVEIKDAEEEAEDAEDADEPSHFEEAIDAASESEE